MSIEKKKSSFFALVFIHSNFDSTQKYPVIPCGVIIKCFCHLQREKNSQNGTMGIIPETLSKLTHLYRYFDKNRSIFFI